MFVKSTHWIARKPVPELGFELFPNGKVGGYAPHELAAMRQQVDILY